MKNPLDSELGLDSSVAREGMSQTVRTEMSWQVWVPVGSSSRMMSFLILELGSVRMEEIWSWAVVREGSGGREERVDERGRVG